MCLLLYNVHDKVVNLLSNTISQRVGMYPGILCYDHNVIGTNHEKLSQMQFYHYVLFFFMTVLFRRCPYKSVWCFVS